MYVRDASHRGLYHLGIVTVGSIFRTEDGLDAKPVGNADDGAQVARVLNAVEGQ